MKNVSRSKRRKLVYLAYCVCAATVPACEIEQDSLRRRYPDTNYGLLLRLLASKHEDCNQLFEKHSREEVTLFTNVSKVSGSTLTIWGFYKS